MGLVIKIDSSKLLKALEIAPREVEKELRVEMKHQMAQVQALARRNHRYKTDTGFLERSVKSKVDKLSGTTFLDDGIADYGKYIHEGFKSWRPDQFLYRAFSRLTSKIVKGMQDAVNRAIRKAGLR